jgi:hypothetical protein
MPVPELILSVPNPGIFYVILKAPVGSRQLTKPNPLNPRFSKGEKARKREGG